MKDKLQDYIQTIFADAPQNSRTADLKEEMYRDLCEKYDDLLSEGKTPASAYHAVIAGVGDISELLEELKRDATGYDTTPPHEQTTPPPNTSWTEDPRANAYRNRSAILTSVAIALYILCVVPVIWAGENIIGLVLMFVMIATATCMLIFNAMTKPQVIKDQTKEERQAYREETKPRSERSPVYKAISGALWCLTVVVYLGVSFAFKCWGYSWLIFLMTAAIDNIIKACFDLKA